MAGLCDMFENERYFWLSDSERETFADIFVAWTVDAIKSKGLFSEESMKLLTIICVFSFLVIALTTACTQSSSSTEIPQPISTPTPTGALTFTSTFTPTATPTNTPITIPTLPEEQARDQLLDLLADNGGCRLPCLLGITPGKTTYTEARAILLPFSGISILTYLNDNSGDSVWLTYDEGDLRTFIQLSYLYANDGIISGIAFKTGEYKETVDNRSPIYDSKIFGERLHPYMLSGILSEFGKPASVVIHTYGKQITGSGGFEIILLYPDQGILVHYTTQMETVGTNARGCPANAQVEVELYPSGDADAFTKSLSETDWAAFVQTEPINDLHWKPIDKATSMSVEQFYETFRQPTDKCIETPLEGWYVPEQ
jgi:hypothetical protein